MTIKEMLPYLPSGTQTRIAQKVGVSKQAVSKALHGLMGGVKAKEIIAEAQAAYVQHMRLKKAVALRAKIALMTNDELLAWAERLHK